jgi:zinc/manganese transport system ATP-binding protein
MSELIRAENLSAGFKFKTIWHNANFVVEPGEFIGLLGANGAGKTTLFRLLLGIEQPFSGSLLVFSKPPERGNPRIGYVPQRRSIDSETKIQALEYVRLGTYGNNWGFSSPAKATRERHQALKSLEQVDALNLAYKPLNELSGGEQQRIFLAQALAGKPDLLLLDEPLANLDIRRESELIKLVQSVAKLHNMAVILIAHDINPLLPVVERIIYIANGKIASGKVDEVVTSSSLSALYDAPIEVLRDSRGRLAVLGVEEAMHHAS